MESNLPVLPRIVKGLRRAFTLVAVLPFGATAWAQADLAGTVSIFDAERGEGSGAPRNRPITSGDRISTGADGRAELRISRHGAALDGAAEAAAPAELPQLVKDEFDAFLECGIVAHGFLRLRCGNCGHDKLVAFSCKRRGFCPSWDFVSCVDHVRRVAPAKAVEIKASTARATNRPARLTGFSFA